MNSTVRLLALVARRRLALSPRLNYSRECLPLMVLCDLKTPFGRKGALVSTSISHTDNLKG
eukprot:6293255-Prymnesium_polylepis.1